MTQTPEKLLPPWLIDSLPEIKRADYVPQRFDDSTHDLWRLELENHTSGYQHAFLKVCNNTNSPFWQIMQQLFGLHLRDEIDNFDRLYKTVSSLSNLPIPRLITAETLNNAKAEENKAYILSSTVSGSVVDDVNSEMVRQLSEYLAGLHGNKNKKWGLLVKADLHAEQWKRRLRQVLTDFSELQNVPQHYLSEAVRALDKIKTHDFVPLMPDLRWDQFMQKDQKLTAMVDLDAFVLAPRELDFVLVEYILTAEQHVQFVEVYSVLHSIPDISEVREAYRLLLYLMQVLGETDIDLWMNAEHRF